MRKLFDFYIKEELLKQCELHFNDFLKEQDPESGYLTQEDWRMVEEQIDYLFEMMDNILTDFKAKGESEFEACAQIIDQLCGYCVLGKMNEARLCNLLNDMTDRKDDK